MDYLSNLGMTFPHLIKSHYKKYHQLSSKYSLSFQLTFKFTVVQTPCILSQHFHCNARLVFSKCTDTEGMQNTANDFNIFTD